VAGGGRNGKNERAKEREKETKDEWERERERRGETRLGGNFESFDVTLPSRTARADRVWCPRMVHIG